MSGKEYQYTPGSFTITDEMQQSYKEDGFVIVKGLLSDAELKHIEHGLTVGAFNNYTFGVEDGDGKAAHMILWNHPGVDVTGMVARCEKVAGSCEQLLGGEVYHYHTKLMKKPAKIGGKHIWHQDYGCLGFCVFGYWLRLQGPVLLNYLRKLFAYWYNNGCLFPKMTTVFIAIDKCTKENSCLQVLPGSHKCGRIEHVDVGGQVGADMTRVDEIAKACPLKYVEMDPGDALFFDCNLLHCSSANLSAKRRWAFLCAYNRADNNPTKEHHHPQYTKLEKVADSAILECQDFTTIEGKWFLDPEEEKRLSLIKIGATEEEQ